jgi:hypothetical protein
MKEMKIRRVWGMPSRHTFKCKPIGEFVCNIVGDGMKWIDPFAGFNSPAEWTNDLNPDAPTLFHLEAIEFVNKMQILRNEKLCVPGFPLPRWNEEFKGCIFDPPYSITQVSKSYNNMGISGWHKNNPTGAFADVKDAITKLLPIGAKTIYFGWNTVGFGKGRGFEIEEILIVSHGGNRNDTLITVETKTN